MCKGYSSSAVDFSYSTYGEGGYCVNHGDGQPKKGDTGKWYYYEIESNGTTYHRIWFDNDTANQDLYKDWTTKTELGMFGVKKIDAYEQKAKKALAGTKFDVYEDAACTKFVETIGPVDDNGWCTSSYIYTVGKTYYVRENKASVQAGYEWNSQVQSVTISTTSKTKGVYPRLEFSNDRIKYPFRLVKYMTGKKSKRIANAVFEVWGSIHTDHVRITTNSEGIAETAALFYENETVYWKEVSVPEPYQLDTTVHSSTSWYSDWVNNSKRVQVENNTTTEGETPPETTEETTDETPGTEPEPGEEQIHLKIYKKDSITGANLAGAVFEIYTDPSCSSDSYVGKMTTNAQGIATSGSLHSNKKQYYIKEVQAPSGYNIDRTSALSYNYSAHNNDGPTFYDTPPNSSTSGTTTTGTTPPSYPVSGRVFIYKLDGDAYNWAIEQYQLYLEKCKAVIERLIKEKQAYSIYVAQLGLSDEEQEEKDQYYKKWTIEGGDSSYTIRYNGDNGSEILDKGSISTGTFSSETGLPTTSTSLLNIINNAIFVSNASGMHAVGDTNSPNTRSSIVYPTCVLDATSSLEEFKTALNSEDFTKYAVGYAMAITKYNLRAYSDDPKAENENANGLNVFITAFDELAGKIDTGEATVSGFSPTSNTPASGLIFNSVAPIKYSETETKQSRKLTSSYADVRLSLDDFYSLYFVNNHGVVSPDSYYIVASGSAATRVTGDDINKESLMYLRTAAFGVYSDAACTNLLETVYANNWNSNIGWYAFTNYYIGGTKLYIKEISAPDGYTPSGKVASCTVPNTEDYNPYWKASTHFFNYKQTARLAVQKKDSKTGKNAPYNGYYSFAGAVYTVYSDSACTNAVGSVTRRGLQQGDKLDHRANKINF